MVNSGSFFTKDSCEAERYEAVGKFQLGLCTTYYINEINGQGTLFAGAFLCSKYWRGVI